MSGDAYPWYSAVSGSDLEQGDIVLSCARVDVQEDGSILRRESDVVILSHSCDLAHDKLDSVQVCPIVDLETLALHMPFFQSRKGREEMRRGHIPGYHLLNRCEFTGHEMDFGVCDFRSVFGVHKATLVSQVESMPSRLRMMPPYREHMAQAFARFFMRVGLPIDIPSFR